MHQLWGQRWRDGIFPTLFGSEDSHVLWGWLLGNLQAARCCPAPGKRQIWGSALSVKWWRIYLRKACVRQWIMYVYFHVLYNSRDNREQPRGLQHCEILPFQHGQQAARGVWATAMHLCAPRILMNSLSKWKMRWSPKDDFMTLFFIIFNTIFCFCEIRRPSCTRAARSFRPLVSSWWQ